MSVSRRPLAAHGQQHTPRRWTQLLKLIGVGMAVVLVSAVGVSAYTVYDLSSQYTDGAVALEGQESVPPNLSAFEGGTNILLVGTDECEEEYASLFGDRCEEDEGGKRNDVNMLLHISDEPRRITAITFPRDLMVATPECTADDGSTVAATSKTQINAMDEMGGLNCVVETIKSLTGLEIPFAAEITWGGVIEITNAIGGVDVCVANGIYDSYTNLSLDPGTHTLAGYEALQFLRTRYGVGDGSDISRVSNQQVYLSALVRKIMSSEVLGDIGTMLKLANTVLTNVRPSESLTNPSLLAQIALAVKDVPYEDINFLQYPVLVDSADENRRVPDYASAEILWDALAANDRIEVSATGNGAVDETPVSDDGTVTPDDTATATPDDDTATPDASATETPDAGVVVLPQNISGQSAGTETCSNGQG